MHHQRHRRDDNQHHHRYRIEHDTQIEVKSAVEERQPHKVIGHQRLEHTVYAVGREVLKGREIGQYSHHSQNKSAEDARSTMAKPFSRQSQNQEREERQ